MFSLDLVSHYNRKLKGPQLIFSSEVRKGSHTTVLIQIKNACCPVMGFYIKQKYIRHYYKIYSSAKYNLCYIMACHFD